MKKFLPWFAAIGISLYAGILIGMSISMQHKRVRIVNGNVLPPEFLIGRWASESQPYRRLILTRDWEYITTLAPHSYDSEVRGKYSLEGNKLSFDPRVQSVGASRDLKLVKSGVLQGENRIIFDGRTLVRTPD